MTWEWRHIWWYSNNLERWLLAHSPFHWGCLLNSYYLNPYSNANSNSKLEDRQNLPCKQHLCFVQKSDSFPPITPEKTPLEVGLKGLWHKWEGPQRTKGWSHKARSQGHFSLPIIIIFYYFKEKKKNHFFKSIFLKKHYLPKFKKQKERKQKKSKNKQKERKQKVTKSSSVQKSKCWGNVKNKKATKNTINCPIGFILSDKAF